MEYLGDIANAEEKVLSDASSLLNDLVRIGNTEPKSVEKAVSLLAQIRDATYENLNQIQHEYFVLRAAQYLLQKKLVPLNTSWRWNPRQTGGISEPDLEGVIGNQILVSAEVTTSKRPIGTILERMKKTLSKLNEFNGNKYYFIRTSEMALKAEEISTAFGYSIEVVCLPYNSDLE